MTDKPAAEYGSYVDAKFMRGLKVLRVSVDVPIERSNEFLRMFGAPDGVNPVPVVIARLDPSTKPAEPLSGVSRAEGPSAHQELRERKRFSELKYAARAALKTQDAAFHDWLRQRYPAHWNDTIGMNGGPDQRANFVLKELLGIRSKTELDANPEKAAEFDKLMTDFDYRDRV